MSDWLGPNLIDSTNQLTDDDDDDDNDVEESRHRDDGRSVSPLVDG